MIVWAVAAVILLVARNYYAWRPPRTAAVVASEASEVTANEAAFLAASIAEETASDDAEEEALAGRREESRTGQVTDSAWPRGVGFKYTQPLPDHRGFESLIGHFLQPLYAAKLTAEMRHIK